MAKSTSSGNIKYSGIRPLQKLGDKAKHFAFANPIYGLTLAGPAPEQLLCAPPDPWPGDVDRGRDLINGVRSFGGQHIESDMKLWEPFGAGADWMAGLHGFAWLRDLRSIGGERARLFAREMVRSWIQQFGRWHEVSWRPDVLGSRIAHWIAFYEFFGASADDAFQHDCLAALQKQSRHIARVLPGRMTGLELMAAIKGLCYSGVCLEDGIERRDMALDMLREQIVEQVLPDGGHVSRSPEQHLAFVRHLIDIRMALTLGGGAAPVELTSAIERMTNVLRFFRHGDGGLALFNGAQESTAVQSDAVLNQCAGRGRAPKSLPDTGYERMGQGRTLVVMDTGTVAPDPYCARAHAGLLSFEMSSGRERIIVNCGTHPAQSQWRDVLRTTAAHSTVTLGDAAACVFDHEGKFASRPDVRCRRNDTKEESLIDAAHDGYAGRMNTAHQRCLYLGKGGETLRGEDRLTGPEGFDFAVRFHLHPNVNVSLIRNGEEALLRLRSGAGWRFRAAELTPVLEESVYLGHGDAPRRTLQLVLYGKTRQDATLIRWAFNRERL